MSTKCPSCAMNIPSGGTKCPYCHENIESDWAALSKLLIIGLVGLSCFFVLSLIVAGLIQLGILPDLGAQKKAREAAEAQAEAEAVEKSKMAIPVELPEWNASMSYENRDQESNPTNNGIQDEEESASDSN